MESSNIPPEVRAAVLAEMETEAAQRRDAYTQMLMRSMKPEYEHDCENCVYIDTVLDSAGKKSDCYIHETDKNKLTFIMRDSSEPSDYAAWVEGPADRRVPFVRTTDGKIYMDSEAIIAQWMRRQYEAGEYPKKGADES